MTEQDYGHWYKKVAVWPDGTLHSLYDPHYSYVVGATTATQKARLNHGGGFYAYPTVSLAVEHDDFDAESRTAILVVKPSGSAVTYADKSSFDRLTVLAVVPIDAFAPAWQAYGAAIATAWQAYDAAIATAWQARNAAVAPAQQAYDAAVDTAQQARNAEWQRICDEAMKQQDNV